MAKQQPIKDQEPEMYFAKAGDLSMEHYADAAIVGAGTGPSRTFLDFDNNISVNDKGKESARIHGSISINTQVAVYKNNIFYKYVQCLYIYNVVLFRSICFLVFGSFYWG